MRHLLILLTVFFAFTFTAQAEDKKETPKEEKEIAEIAEEEIEEEEVVEENTLYAPDYCDFQVNFPEAPYSRKRCPHGTNKCYQLTSYTMVYDLSTTVDINVTCVPSNANNFRRYNERVIRNVLDGMVSRANISEYNINTEEDEKVRKGSLLGADKYAKQNRIYNAQIWVGHNSIMTVEAKLIGRAHGEADTVYGDILGSIQQKEEPKKKPKEEKPN